MKAKSAPNILITGGAGYVGSVMTRLLLEQGCRVTVLDNFLYRQHTLLDCCGFDTFTVVRGDCRDERRVAELMKKSDVIIPLAAIVGAPSCDRDPTAARSTNTEAVRMICRLASKSQRILFPVTNSGYGVGEKGKFCTEDSPLNPISLYGVTKVEAEQALLERENSITFRLATAFGVSPRMRMDLLVNDFVWRAITDRAVVIFEGHFKRNYIHVSDIANVFWHGIRNFEKMKGKPYNVGLEEANLSKLELCAEIKKLIPSFVFFESAIGEDVDKRDYIVSNKRILAAGFKPQWTLAAGIRQLLKGYTMIRNPILGNT